MDVLEKVVSPYGVKFFVEYEGEEIAHAYIYILRNDLHEKPFGFMEDVHVDDAFQRQGIGTSLVRRVIEEAQRIGCYKLICTSRDGREDSVHQMYMDLGFTSYGREFRMNF